MLSIYKDSIENWTRFTVQVFDSDFRSDDSLSSTTTYLHTSHEDMYTRTVIVATSILTISFNLDGTFPPIIIAIISWHYKLAIVLKLLLIL